MSVPGRAAHAPEAPAPGELDFAVVLANAVHDAKNALALIVGALERIAEACDPETFPAHAEVERLRHEGARVNDTLIQLLALYRMRGGSYRAAVRDQDVDECLEECALELGPDLAARGLTLTVAAAGVGEWYFDRELVTSVLRGAIGNAARSARSRVQLRARAVDGWLELRVEDDGPGYPASILAGGPEAVAELGVSREGTGLGLFFASEVAGAHRSKGRAGSIGTRNGGALGGARFTLRLP